MYHFFSFNIDSEKIYKFLNQIKKQSIYSLVFELLIELFKINQACLLAIFVPQKCYTKDSNCNIDYSLPPHMCTILENTICLSPYNTFVLYFNIFTIFCFLILYVIEIRRELWLLDHFDYEENININNLEIEKENNIILFNKLNYCNKIYFNIYILMTIIYIINFFSSAILVLVLGYYLNISSVTVFISSVLLCSNKVIYGTYIAYYSYYNNKPTSYYTKYNLSYNEIKLEHTSNFANKLHNLFVSISHNELNNFFKKNNINLDIINNGDIQIEVQKTNSSKKFNVNNFIYPNNIEFKKNSLNNSSIDNAEIEKNSSIDNTEIRKNSLTNISPKNKFNNNLVIEINELNNNVIIKTQNKTDKIPFNNMKNIINNSIHNEYNL